MGRMEAALLGSLVFPPPAAGAEVFTHGDGPSAGLAADAGHELVVQRVVGHAVRGDVVPHVVPAPVGQGAELDAALVVELAEGHLAAVVALLATQPGHPSGAISEHAR